MNDIRDFLIYYYDIYLEKKSIGDKKIFFYNNHQYYLKEYDEQGQGVILNNSYCAVVNNKYGFSFSLFENKKYILYVFYYDVINTDKNELIVDLMKETNVLNYFDESYYYLKKEKIASVEKYFSAKPQLNQKYNVDMFLGFSFSSLQLLKTVGRELISYGNCIKSFNINYSIHDYLITVNNNYGPLGIGVARLIKHIFFIEKKQVDFIGIIDSFSFNYYDYILLLSELIWPSYFISGFKRDYDWFDYYYIECNLQIYFKGIKIIFDEIKKRYNDISYLYSLINLF